MHREGPRFSLSVRGVVPSLFCWGVYADSGRVPAWCGTGSLPGRAAAALTAQASRWARWLEANPEQDWPNVVHTAAVYRSHLSARASVLADNQPDTLHALAGLAGGHHVCGGEVLDADFRVHCFFHVRA